MSGEHAKLEDAHFPIPHYPASPIDACVARICDRGCGFVYQTIDRMRAGEDACDSEDLTPMQRRAVLTELEEIMAVYAGRVCSVRAD